MRAPWISASVTPRIAETMTTRRSQAWACSTTIAAACVTAGAPPTDVPPNFITNVFIASSSLPGLDRILYTVRGVVKWKKRTRPVRFQKT